MKYRKGIFALTYAIKNKKIYYLILKRKLHWSGWEFPKGGIDNKESEIQALKREIKEETGLKIDSIKKYKLKGKYNYNKKLQDRPGLAGQTYSLYSVKVKKQTVKIDKREHHSYKWLEYKEAIKLLTWENQKKCLKLINSKLSK